MNCFYLLLFCILTLFSCSKKEESKDLSKKVDAAIVNGTTEEVVSILQPAVKNNPEDFRTRMDLVYALFLEGNKKEMNKHIDTLQAKFPNNKELSDFVGGKK